MTNSFCFAPTDDADINARFCWKLMDWLRDQERAAADRAMVENRDPETFNPDAPMRAHYDRVISVAEHIHSEMRGDVANIGFDKVHDEPSIAQMVDAAIHPWHRNPPAAWPEKLRAGVIERQGSGAAVVARLIADARQSAKGWA